MAKEIINENMAKMTKESLETQYQCSYQWRRCGSGRGSPIYSAAAGLAAGNGWRRASVPSAASGGAAAAWRLQPQ